MPNQQQFSSEEDIKARLILPLLKQMGISAGEISLEGHLNIRLGRAVYPIERKPGEKAKGFYDLLVKKGGVSLFVVETKNPKNPLTAQDRDQAISYARLLVTPFAIVSNGLQTQIYDAITEERLDGRKLKSPKYANAGYLITITEDVRFQAERYFIGLNRENLDVFCRSQREFRMKHLLGSQSDKTKVFIPDVFVERQKVTKKLESFLAEPKSCFLIVGESGIGKTTAMCAAANSVGTKYPSLFVDCSRLAGSIDQAVAEDFNWVFPAQHSPIQLVKRLEELLTRAGTNLIVFLEAIDECERPNFEAELSSFIGRAKHHRIKLVLSCKVAETGRLLKIKGTPSELKEELFLAEPHAEASVTLERFNDSELEEASKKYKFLFPVTGSLAGRLKEECRLGFLLRIVYEVYSASAQPLPADISSKELVARYLKTKSEKISNASACISTLRGLATLLAKENKREISEDALKSYLGLRSIDFLEPELFSHCLLAKREVPGGDHISFYFDKLRDYLIAFEILKLPEMKPVAFKKFLAGVSRPSVLDHALLFFVESAEKETKKMYAKHLIKSNQRLDFLGFISSNHLLTDFVPDLKSLMRKTRERSYLYSHLPEDLENLRNLGFLLRKMVQDSAIFELMRVIKSVSKKKDAEFILDFLVVNYEQFASGMYAEDSAEIIKKIVQQHRELSRDALNAISSMLDLLDRETRHKKQRNRETTVKNEIGQTLLLIYDLASQDGDLKTQTKVLKILWSRFSLIHDNSEYLLRTPEPIYRIVRQYLEADLKARLPGVVSMVCRQFWKEWRFKFRGYEVIGLGIGQSGGEYSIDDLALVRLVFQPAIKTYYESSASKERAWHFLLRRILEEKMSAKNPLLLKRACLPVVFERLMSTSKRTRAEATDILKQLMDFRKGIPTFRDIILSHMLVKSTVYDKKIILDLLEKDIEASNLPSNVFSVKLFFNFIGEGNAKAKGLFLKVLQNPKYFDYDTVNYDTLENLSFVAQKQPVFVEGVVRLFLNNEKWMTTRDSFGFRGMNECLEQIALADWAAGKGGQNNRSLRLLAKLLGDRDMNEAKQRIIFPVLRDLARQDAKKIFSFLWNYIRPINNLSSRFSLDYGRECIADIAEALLAKDKGYPKDALRLIDKLIDDPDPRIDEPGQFNYHLKIKAGEGVSTISGVRTKICWALQKLTPHKEHLPPVLRRVKKLAHDENLYVRANAVVPLIELVRRRKLNRNSNFIARVKELCFQMMGQNHQYPAIMEHLIHAFDVIRDLKDDEAKRVLKAFWSTENAAVLFIYFALYRHGHFPELGRFNAANFKTLLGRQILCGPEQMRARIAWHFWRMAEKQRADIPKFMPFASKFLEAKSGLTPQVMGHLLKMTEDVLKYNFSMGYQFFVKLLETEKIELRKIKKDDQLVSHYGHYSGVFTVVSQNDEEKFLKTVELFLSYTLTSKMAIYDIRNIAQLLGAITSPIRRRRVRACFRKLEKFNPHFHDMLSEWEARIAA